MSSSAPSDVVRPEVTRLAAHAPLAPEDDDSWTVEKIDQFAADIDAVTGPVNHGERDLLLALLDRPWDDAIYGVLWTVLHLIETAPRDGYEFRLPTADRPWFMLLHTRRLNIDN